MSLRVWLPLTKDLRNQGLSSVNVTNHGATYQSTGGKLGGCYYFSGSTSSYISTDYPTNIDTSDFSISLWVKIPTMTSGSYYAICTSKTASATSAGFGIYWNYSQKKFLWSTADGSSATEIWMANTVDTIVYDNWIHLVMVRDSNDAKKGYFYINGVRYELASVPAIRNISTVSNLYLGMCRDNYYPAKMYLNDFRIYDHALSQMEVKELSKGLVLHYPLNRGGFGQENILLNTGFQARYTQSTGWDTTKNGTQLASSWGGYNSGVGNQATVYHAHLKEFNGEWVYEYIKTANESWLGISQGGLQSKLTAGKKYTFSWEQYSVSGSNYNHGGLYYYKTGATSANFHLGSFSGTGGITGQWKKFSYTFTAPSDADYSKNMSWYIYGMSGGNGTLYMRHPKLEEGESATPWCPNSSDTLATTIGLNSTTEYDCSGFCNNGTRTGTFSWTSDTPKYAVSTQFTGTQFITADSPTSEGATLALWAKTTSTGNAALAIDYKSKIGFGFWSGVIIPSCNGNIKTTYSTTNYIINQWNHIVVVRNSSSTLQLYINGVLQTNTTSAQDYWSGGVIDGLSIAARPNGSSPVSCQISDVRIYATALSTDDVQSLYQNSAYIDSSGNVYGAVHSEV